MSFSFGFDLEDAESDSELGFSTTSLSHLSLQDSTKPVSDSPTTSLIPYSEVLFSDLLATLPPLLSFTPLTVPLSSSSTSLNPVSTILLRRDLFDARFQVLAQDNDGEPFTAEEKAKGKGKETFVDQETDLVKGVYEGGLKTWECSLDLVDALDGLRYGAEVETGGIRGKSVFEHLCELAGRIAVRSLRPRGQGSYNSKADNSDTSPRLQFPRQVHFPSFLEVFPNSDQRKNPLLPPSESTTVLSLITLPNLLLTYAQHLASQSKSEDGTPLSLSSQPGEIEVTPEFLESFEKTLKDERIEFRFFQGDWSGFTSVVDEKGWKNEYDVVLTSETIYSLASLPALLSLLKASSTQGADCLVACKRIYFGVGGGEVEFRRRVEEMGGQVKTIWGEGEGQGKTGVGRVVMRVEWD